MGSYNYGKEEVCEWIRQHFPKDASILDVGAGDGKWKRLLPEYENMDAIEAYFPNTWHLIGAYRNIITADICDCKYDYYDLIIFGDIIEHLTIEQAQSVLEYAKTHCKDMVIAVPFLYEQDAIYGNPYEVHVQSDLTRELFAERYKGFDVLCDAAEDYCYYHKRIEI